MPRVKRGVQAHARHKKVVTVVSESVSSDLSGLHVSMLQRVSAICHTVDLWTV